MLKHRRMGRVLYAEPGDRSEMAGIIKQLTEVSFEEALRGPFLNLV